MMRTKISIQEFSKVSDCFGNIAIENFCRLKFCLVPDMDKLWQTGQTLGRVFNFRSDNAHAAHAQATFRFSPVRYHAPQCQTWLG